MSTTAPTTSGRTAQAEVAQEREPRRNKLAFWLLLPASVILLLVLGYPIVRMVVLSLQEAKLRNITRGTEAWRGQGMNPQHISNIQ